MSSSCGAVALLCRRRRRLCWIGEGARDADEDGVIDAAGLDDRRRRRRVPCCGRGSAADDGSSQLTEEVMRSDDDDDVDEGGKNEYDEPVIVER